jgi:uncharacterized protein (TIGR02271 family)
MYDREGDKIGRIEEIYLDQQTDSPEWALVNTGLFGSKSTFVPIGNATPGDDGVRVPFEKSQVKDAPNVDPDGELSQSQESELYSYYGMDYGESRSDTGLAEGRAGTTGAAGGTDVVAERDRGVDLRNRNETDVRFAGDTGEVSDRERHAALRDRDEVRDPDAVGRDVSAPTTDDAMTRSEEEVRVDTEQREAGRARLRKYVVTDEVQETVPVRREEVRIEREPITDANVDDATAGPDISEEEHEVTLMEEEVVADKRVVPKERVRLDKETVTDEREVSEEVRKEQIEAEGVDERTVDPDRRR